MAWTGWALLGAMLLGALQGLTEFLPVSSSGHLVVFQEFIEVSGDAVFFDLMLHVGTLIPAIWFYRRDVRTVIADATSGEGEPLQRPGVRLAALVVVASVPTGVIGILFKDLFEELFLSPGAVAVAFAVTGAVLYATRGRDDGTLDALTTPWSAAFLIGLAQGLAITPGISRSGSTIAAAMLLGLEREFAVKLSFLMSVPAITGAVLLKSREVDFGDIDLAAVAVGTLTALVVGYFALVWLVRLVKRGQFSSFCWYVWAMSIVAAFVAWG
jgi:undecaprenyl-diphosphatase